MDSLHNKGADNTSHVQKASVLSLFGHVLMFIRENPQLTPHSSQSGKLMFTVDAHQKIQSGVVEPFLHNTPYCPLQHVELQCPQQKGGFQCGYFAIVNVLLTAVGSWRQAVLPGNGEIFMVRECIMRVFTLVQPASAHSDQAMTDKGALSHEHIVLLLRSLLYRLANDKVRSPYFHL